jgi:hypothetical protein
MAGGDIKLFTSFPERPAVEFEHSADESTAATPESSDASTVGDAAMATSADELSEGTSVNPTADTAPESFWAHAVDVADLSAGDHIYVYKWQWNMPFQHHGIVLYTEGTAETTLVAHFAPGTDGIEQLPLSVFLSCGGVQGQLRRAQYGENLVNFVVKVCKMQTS